MNETWVGKARAHCGKTMDALAEEINVTKGSVWGWENGKHPPSLETMIDISLVTGYPLPSKLIGKIAAVLEISSSHTAKGIGIPALTNNDGKSVSAESLDDDVISGVIVLTPEFITKKIKPTQPNALRFIHVYDDSMAPTLNRGAVLLVDTGSTDLKKERHLCAKHP